MLALVVAAALVSPGTKLLLFTPALLGIACIALVDFRVLHEGGFILSAPALVPLALALAKIIKRR